jgi:DNA-binding NarL/FixJ family response regulator
MTQIMLVDDHSTLRQAIAFFLEQEPGFEVVAQAGTLAEARRLLTEDVDLAIVDLALPDGNGREFIEDLHMLNSEAIVLVLTARTGPEVSALVAQDGVAEVLHKSAGVAEIVEAIKQVTIG